MEMRNKKVAGDYVPGDVLQLWGGNLKIMTKLNNTIYMKRESY
jgi:muramoyltetrapeptide carboxypeptidase LdcA involved in peptidoglycan recycling